MSEPTLPVIFAELTGQQPRSQLDLNFAFLLGLITGMNAGSVSFNDNIGLGATNVQTAIEVLNQRIGAGGGASSPSLDLSQSANSQYDQIAQGA